MIYWCKTVIVKLEKKSNLCNNPIYKNKSKIYEQCIAPYDVEEQFWCYTRKHLNDSAMTGNWGYCDPSCQGPETKENIDNMGIKNSDLWSEDIFLLVDQGHCHTYNPVYNSYAGARGLFYAMLGPSIINNHFMINDNDLILCNLCIKH